MTQTQLGLEIVDIESGAPIVLLNRNAQIVTALMRGLVVSIAATAPPGSSTDGDLHYVPVGATGGWAGQDGKFAIYSGGWVFITGPYHWQGYSTEDSAVRTFTNGTWS